MRAGVFAAGSLVGKGRGLRSRLKSRLQTFEYNDTRKKDFGRVNIFDWGARVTFA